MIDVELDRERNDLYFGNAPRFNYGDVGAGEAPDRHHRDDDEEEAGAYGIRIVYPDGLENDVELGLPLPVARRVAGHARDLLADSELGARVIITTATGRIINEETT